MFRQPVELVTSKGRQNKDGKRQCSKRGRNKKSKIKQKVHEVILCTHKRALLLARIASA